jgi:hypothetical protein
MKLLIIDSHKGNRSTPQNLHWLNASKIQAHLVSVGHSVDLIWSYPDVNDTIHTGYDAIIFNHASRYSYISDEWLVQNPQAKLYYTLNDYNLGEPVLLWSWVKKHGIKYDVIANHQADASKVVTKYVDKWNIVNMNSLITETTSQVKSHSFFSYEKSKCIYYGTFRRDRTKYFQKYLTGNIIISTHSKNRSKFESIGITGPFSDRIDWNDGDLGNYKTLLYIEDETTHVDYSCLANRFYEAINYDVFPLFDSNCINTIRMSGYDIPDYAIVDSPRDVEYITNHLPSSHEDYLLSWRNRAIQERDEALDNITKLVTS